VYHADRGANLAKNQKVPVFDSALCKIYVLLFFGGQGHELSRDQCFFVNNDENNDENDENILNYRGQD